jgi:predicted secreted hydrolase
MREWWYFNVHFDKTDSELRNWSAMVSFNHLCRSFEEPDMLFITLYDDKNHTYGGMLNREDGALIATGPGVHLKYETSWVEGSYPFWLVHVEDLEADSQHEIILDLEFKAEVLPYWVWTNTGLGLSKSPLGYYSINYCDVRGTISLDGVKYSINGTGYHDHTWALLMIGGSSTVWDWFSIHFDNGLHAFIWQINPVTKLNKFTMKPGFGWITDGKNYSDFKAFTLKYVELIDTSIPEYHRPKIFELKSNFFNSKITLTIETDNIHEYLWGELPIIDIALWEGSCKVNGFISINDESEEISGIGIAEILRII